MRNIVKKIHKKSERTRKIILWIAVCILALILLSWWINSTKSRFKDLNSEPNKQLESMPRLDFSEVEEPLEAEKPIEEILENIEPESL